MREERERDSPFLQEIDRKERGMDGIFPSSEANSRKQQ